MEPNNTPAPEPNSTPQPEPATPNPEPTDATPANPAAGTGQAPEPQQQLRNQPDNGQGQPPEGYIPSEKFTASQQEALRMREILQKHGIDPKTGEPTQPAAQPTAQPTAPIQPQSYEQAVQQIPGFESLTKEQQALVMNPRQAYKDIEDMRTMVAQMYDAQETTKQINDLTKQEAYSDIDKDEFREFIYRDENIGVKNLETLAKLFKQEQAEAAAAEPPKPEGAEPKTAGAKEIATGDGVQELTASDAAQLRTQDPRRYAKLVRTGKLKIVSE